jgi:DNA-binding CsgD family transcriptional regulator/predicted enzyme related to lactoylglutathione lyase
MSRQERRGRGRPRCDDILTPAEWRVVHAAQHGMTNRQIAARCGITVDAVKYHFANVRAKLGLSRQALLHWFAAPKASALARQEKHVVSKLELGSIGQISRSVRDVKEAVNFYGSVLGLPHLFSYGSLAFFDCGGTRLYLDEKEQVQPESILYFAVDDIERAYTELESRGVEFTNAPHMIFRHADGTEEWMAFFKDPEDRPLAIMAQLPSRE